MIWPVVNVPKNSPPMNRLWSQTDWLVFHGFAMMMLHLDNSMHYLGLFRRRVDHFRVASIDWIDYLIYEAHLRLMSMKRYLFVHRLTMWLMANINRVLCFDPKSPIFSKIKGIFDYKYTYSKCNKNYLFERKMSIINATKKYAYCEYFLLFVGRRCTQLWCCLVSFVWYTS